jgi:hypothetical protein
MIGTLVLQIIGTLIKKTDIFYLFKTSDVKSINPFLMVD